MAKKILIVEDDDDIRNSLIELLSDEGYIAEGARDGLTALESLRSGSPLPSLIFLDLMMPGMGGFEFRQAQEADARIAHIPVVAMTADAHAEAKKYKVGARALIKKPIHIEEILEIAARLA